MVSLKRRLQKIEMRNFLSGVAKKKYLILLIIGVAVIFRFWQLDNVPPGLYPDIATNGTDAINANQNFDYKIFYPANNGREGLFINLIALSFKVLGTGIWQLRIVGAIIGVLTVYGTYLLTKEFFEENAALFASFFMATGFWAVNFSRIGFRAIMVPFILVFSLYFFLRKLEDNKKPIWDFIIAGLFFGLGFYTYISFKIAPLILIVLGGFILATNRLTIQKNWKGIILFTLITAIIAFPILWFQFASKDAAVRTGQVSILNPQVNKGDLIGTALKTTLLSFGMFNFYGDPNWRHNFANMPALNFAVGIFFIVGIIISLKKLFIRKVPMKDKMPLVLIFSWILAMFIPAILTEEGMPHSLRSIGTMVPAFVMAGIGANYLSNILYKQRKKLAKIAIVILTSSVLISDFIIYFDIWAKKPEVIDQFTTRYVEIARYFNKIPNEIEKYVVVNEPGTIVDGFPVQAQTIKFLTYGKSNVTFLNPDDVEKIKIDQKTVIADLKNDKRIETYISQNHTIDKIDASEIITSNQSTNFVVYFVQ